jgi:hypothetical protein
MKARILVLLLLLSVSFQAARAVEELDPYTVQETLSRFPFAQVVPLGAAGSWGVIYANTYGNIHVLRYTDKGWRLEWKLTNLGAKIANFLIDDIERNGVYELIVATVDGQILVYSMDDYTVVWENLESRFEKINTLELADIDNDPQLEFFIVADDRIYILDGENKSRQWVSPGIFEASEIIVANVDKDEQLEIILNTGIVIDSRFFNIEIEWDKPFGDRILTGDINNDGYPEVIGEFSDYSLRVFDVYAERELW